MAILKSGTTVGGKQVLVRGQAGEFTGEATEPALFANTSVTTTGSKYGINRSAVTVQSGVTNKVFSNCVLKIDNTTGFTVRDCIFSNCYINFLGNANVVFANCLTVSCQIAHGHKDDVLEFQAGDCYNCLIYTSVKATNIRFVNTAVVGNTVTVGNLFDNCIGNYPNSLNNVRIPFESHENLLINHYFPTAINQRGKTEYTTAGYTIDGWYQRANQKLTVESDCIRIESADAFYQPIEISKYPELKGRAVTLSLLCECVKNGGGDMGLINQNSWCYSSNRALPTTTGKQLISITQIVPADSTSLYFWIYAAANSVYKLYAAKFELGIYQTLAHKEGDVWVLNEIPNPTLELEKCQRYLYLAVPSNFDCGIPGEITDTMKNIAFDLQFPTMRTAPVLVGSPKPRAVLRGADYKTLANHPQSSGLTVHQSKPNRISLGAKFDSNLPNGVVTATLDTLYGGDPILLSAEL